MNRGGITPRPENAISWQNPFRPAPPSPPISAGLGSPALFFAALFAGWPYRFLPET